MRDKQLLIDFSSFLVLSLSPNGNFFQKNSYTKTITKEFQLDDSLLIRTRTDKNQIKLAVPI